MSEQQSEITKLGINHFAIGKWQGPITAGGREYRTSLGHDPKNKVLGILGMGGIGRVSASVYFGDYDATDITRKWPSEPKLLE